MNEKPIKTELSIVKQVIIWIVAVIVASGLTGLVLSFLHMWGVS